MQKLSPINNTLWSLSGVNSELISFGMLVCNVVQVCALWNISVGTNFSFVMCSPGRETSSIYGHSEGV